MIEGLARRGGAMVSLPARDDALNRKRTNAATFTNLIYSHFIFTSHCRACQDSLIYPSTYYLLPRPITLTRLVTMLARLIMALARLVMTLTRLSRHWQFFFLCIECSLIQVFFLTYSFTRIRRLFVSIKVSSALFGFDFVIVSAGLF
jgi:hypothetical protein